ncbi:MAG TPA: arsinothricin resistance N-acetyltransferase ArsN1 family B [Gemmatimonadaceae bacterium]
MQQLISYRPIQLNDAPGVVAIYNHYVANTCITFETEPVSMIEMERRIAATLAAPLPWLVAEESGRVIGYSCASKWKSRAAYRYSVESTVYIEPSQIGKGVGNELYSRLIVALRDISMHAVIGGIALPNEASIALHERLGFKRIGQFEQVGFKQNRWVDVGYWQLVL